MCFKDIEDINLIFSSRVYTNVSVCVITIIIIEGMRKMNMEYKVSIIIPIYNEELYLEQCLESVYSQTYSNLEIILINDGSTDQSGEICKCFMKKDPRVIYYEQENYGQGIARNKGIEKSTGKYITFIDADDWVDEKYIEILLDTIADCSADIVRAGIQHYDEMQGVFKKLDIPEAQSDDILCYAVPQIAGNLYEKKLFIANEIKMPKGKYEDLAVYPLLVMKSRKVKYVDATLYYYRINTGNSTMDNVDNVSDCRGALEYLINEGKRIGIYQKNIFLFLKILLMHMSALVDRYKEILSFYQYRKLMKDFINTLNEAVPNWEKLRIEGSWLLDNIIYKEARSMQGVCSPKISILIPVYNVENYLRICLDSVLTQTLQDIEIICINDGSSDGSLDILYDYQKKDARVHVITKENTGYGNSMNLGLALARGEYVGILESDDFTDTNMYEELYRMACLNDAEVVKSNYFEFSTNNGYKENYIAALSDCNYNVMFTPYYNRKIFFSPPTIWSAIYKRSFLNEKNIRFNETPGASYQDTSFSFKVWALAQKVMLTDKAYIRYRIDNDHSSVASNHKVYCICDEYDEIERFIKEKFNGDDEFARFAVMLRFRAYFWNYQRLSGCSQYVFFSRFYREFSKYNENGMLNDYHWSKLDCERLEAVLKKDKKYYYETGKMLQEVDIYSDGIRDNMGFYWRSFLGGINLYKNIVIYGAGVVGRRLGKNIEKELGKGRVWAYAETVKQEEDMINGTPILEIRKIPIKEIDIIVIASRKSFWEEMYLTAVGLGFNNIVIFDEKLNAYLKKEIIA